MTTITDMDNFVENKISLREEWRTVSMNGVGYGKMEVRYDDKQFLFVLPTCKTFGVHSTEMGNGYVRKTMPLILEEPKTREQERFVIFFDKITQRVYDLLVERGYNDDERLEKLDSWFWRSKVLFPTVTESLFNFENNSRFFIGNEEVKKVQDGQYEANAALLIDSIYIGEKTISIQVKLYEVSLTPTKIRARVLI